MSDDYVYDTNGQMEKFKEFFKQKEADIDLTQPSINFDFVELAKFDYKLADMLLEKPDDILKIASAAMESVADKPINVRVENLAKTEHLAINNIRSSDLNKLKTIKGNIMTSSKVTPVAVSSTFVCPNCMTEQVRLHVNNTIKYPNKCSCGRIGKFTKLSSKLVDTITGMLEELPENAGKHQTHALKFVMRGDLCKNLLLLGARMEMVGILYETPIFKYGGIEQATKDFVFEVLSYKNLDDPDMNPNPTADEQKAFDEIKSSRNPVKHISKILFPDIYGNTMAREWGILQAACGTRNPDGTRDTINFGLFGDYGIAKSRIASRLADIAPIGMFVSAVDVSGPGLTITTLLDKETKQYYAKAGLLPKCNGGLLVLDEIDKVDPKIVNTLHTPIESGYCTCNKGGINAKVVANTAILVTGNTDVVGNIALPVGILDRLDAQFKIFDKADRKRDKLIASKVINNNTFEEDSTTSVKNNTTSVKNNTTSAQTLTTFTIPMIKKYIYNCKRISPKLSRRLTQEVISWYVEIRQGADIVGWEGKKITVRTLEGALRVARAIARIHQSHIVTKKMLMQAIDYMAVNYPDYIKTIEPEDVDDIEVKGKVEGSMTAGEAVEFFKKQNENMSSMSKEIKIEEEVVEDE